MTAPNPPVVKSMRERPVHKRDRGWTRENMAWFAGLVEGEGSIGMNPGPRITIAMTDRDVLDRVRVVTGCGTIRGPYDWNQKKPGRENWNVKPIYYWSCPVKDAYALLVAIWPWLLSRRQEAASVVIEEYRFVKPRNGHKAECHVGHPFTPENTYVDGVGQRHCRRCRAKDAKNFRSRRAL